MEGTLASLDTLNSRQFFIAIRKLADSLGYGTDRSRFLGSGNEYVQSRPYQWGDPIRSIDWRITARTGRVHIKEYEAPKQIPAYLLVDTSASMTVSSRALSKYGLAVHLAGGLAFALLDRVSPVGIVGIGSRPLRFPPSLSRDKVMLWLHQLKNYRFDEPTQLEKRLGELATMLPCKSLIIVLSDLQDPEGMAILKRMGQEHDCIALHLIDPAEFGIPGAGLIRAREAETGREMVFPARRIAYRPELIASELRKGAVEYLPVRTDQPFVAKLRQFFKSRGVLGKGKR